MNLKILISVLFASLLSGCFSPTYVVVPLPPLEAAVNLPDVIEFDGEKFKKQNETNMGAEYYLEGESGYEWSKLLTILNATYVKNIDEYIEAIKVSHDKNKQINAKYEIVKLNEFQSFQKELYTPIAGDKNFSQYEINYNLSTIQECGIVSVAYAKRYAPSSDAKKLEKIMQEGARKFLNLAPKISCKE